VKGVAFLPREKFDAFSVKMTRFGAYFALTISANKCFYTPLSPGYASGI